MSGNAGLARLKSVLTFFAAAYLFYGVSFLLLPGLLSDLSGDPVHVGWIRWSGGPLLALGFGAVRVLRNPSKQDAFIQVATIAAFLIGTALLYSRLFEPGGKHAWFTLTPCFINLALFGLLLWARRGAKDVLS